MRRLDGASAHMIYMDQPGQYQHTLKIAMLDFSHHPGGYNFGAVRASIEEQVLRIPFMRWKILRVPLGINHPYWVHDLGFDVSHHVRRVACPAPGDRTAFCQLVSELYAQTLSKSLPLWTLWMVEGLQDGRVAMVIMLHHAYCDGVGASLLLQRLTSPFESTDVSDHLGVNPHKNPSRFRLFLQGTLELPLMFLRELPPLIRDGRKLRKVARRYKKEGRALPPNPAEARPSSLLNAPMGHARCFYYDSFDLNRFKLVGKRLSVTINDLLMAVVSGAIGSYSAARRLPVDGPAVAAIPISLRNEQQKQEILGNYLTTEAITLPVDIADPRQRLDTVSSSAREMKAYIKDTNGVGLTGLMELLPPFLASLISWAVRRSEGKLSPFGNLMISNVAGPRQPLRFGQNIEISQWLSIGQAGLGIGVNLTAWSYVDQFNICLLGNPAVIHDGENFFSHIREALSEYEQLADQESVADMNTKAIPQ